MRSSINELGELSTSEDLALVTCMGGESRYHSWSTSQQINRNQMTSATTNGHETLQLKFKRIQRICKLRIHIPTDQSQPDYFRDDKWAQNLAEQIEVPPLC